MSVTAFCSLLPALRGSLLRNPTLRLFLGLGLALGALLSSGHYALLHLMAITPTMIPPANAKNTGMMLLSFLLSPFIMNGEGLRERS